MTSNRPTALVAVILTVAFLFTAAFPRIVTAEETDSGTSWWLKTALIGGAIGLTMTLDDEINESVLDNKSASWETFADVTRPWGEWVVFVPVGVGLSAAGWVAGDDAVRIAGERASVSIAVSAVLEGIGKYSFSRRRPSSAENSRDFEFFSSHSSFPSGHATVAFALSKSLSDDINRPWATVGLYTIATASAYARLVDNMHWASDLVAGAAVGYFSAVLVRSKILRPHHEGPHLALTPGGPGLAWNF